MTDHHSTRRARALDTDKKRQKKRRERLKEAGAPTTHVLNRAIAEGLLYWLDAERAKGVPVSKAAISVQQVLVYATEVLTKKTNATDRYAVPAVHKAIRSRIYRVSDSKFRIAPTWVAPQDDED